MRRTTTYTALVLAVIAGRDCSCEENLSSSVGELHLEVCDNNASCGGCDVLDGDEGETIEFGSPNVGSQSLRALVIVNDNPGQILVIERFELDDPSGDFSILAIQKRSSAADDAVITPHDTSAGELRLIDLEQAEVLVAYEPTSLEETIATLAIVSNSATRPNWELTLRAGPGDGEVDVNTGICPASPPSSGEPNCDLEFGRFPSDDLGWDVEFEAGKLFGTESFTITNTGDRNLYIGVELLNDGIPEQSPLEPVGEKPNAAFYLTNLACSIVAPGDSLPVEVEFRPLASGTWRGEVRITGLGGDFRVGLVANVNGPYYCIRTEDEHPDDAVLLFGYGPLYETPQNAVSEERHIYISNCGFDADLEILNVLPGVAWDDAFHSPDLPWGRGTVTLAVGEETAIPFTFAPDATNIVGGNAYGLLQIQTNVEGRNTATAELTAGIGAPEQCRLVASPADLDFGWVASDEAGASCPLCTPDSTISRAMTFVLSNTGRRDCTGIDFDPVIFGPDSTDLFSVRNNPNPAAFTLAPGQSSQPIEVVFAKAAAPAPTSHLATIPVREDALSTIALGACPSDRLCVDLFATGGGNPDCALTFQPVRPAGGLFGCPNDTLAFGNVNIGNTKTVDLKAVNTGSATCTVTGIALAGGGTAFSFVPPPLPATIPVNASITVPVSFTPIPPSGTNPFEEIDFGCFLPVGFGGHAMTFNWYSGTDTTDTGTKTLSLSGKGTRPDIDVIPGEIDFGEVTVGCCSANVDVSIYNSGDGTLSIDAFGLDCVDNGGGYTCSVISNGSGTSDIGYEIVTPPSDLSLDPGESTTFTVRWCSVAVGDSSGIVEIVSSDDNEEYFTVAVSGSGVLTSSASDLFQQPSRPKVDVLWVVDDSGSMSDEQTTLANNFDAFINTATGLDTDYHLGVVNTEVVTDEAGKLYACSGPLWITDAQPATDQRNQFRCNVKTSSWPRPKSDSKEAAMQAARLALDYPHLDGFNAGFYREDAKLYIILVTDEVDQSDGTAQLYVDYFRNLKGLGNPELLNISAISGPPPDGCSTSDGNAEGNQPGFDAVQMVGGQFHSICTPDWTTMIQALGLDVFNARRQFPLSRPAEAPTITVTVCDAGGVSCHVVPQDPANGWTFDSDLNAITFNGDEVPGPGQEVTVDYTAVCFQ